MRRRALEAVRYVPGALVAILWAVAVLGAVWLASVPAT